MALAAVLAAGLLAAPAATAAPRGPAPGVTLRVLSHDQAAAARKGRLLVRVRVRGAAIVRVGATSRIGSGRSFAIAPRRSVRFRRAGRRTVALRLTRGARSRMRRSCQSARVRVRFRARRLTGRRSTGRLRRGSGAARLRSARVCLGPAARPPGSPTGPAGDPENPTPRDAGNTSDVNTANADRCDFLDPSVCLYPFPNDLFTKADPKTDTGRRINFNQLSMPRSGADTGSENAGKPIEAGDYNLGDGFSPGQALVTRIPGLDNPEAFRRTGAVPIDDPARSFDPEQPVVVINTRTGLRHMIWAEIDSNPADLTKRTLIIRPAVNFEEGTRYIVALRNLKNDKGEAIPARRAFQLYRDRLITNRPEIEGRREKMEEILSTLRQSGIRRSDLHLAWDFTVASARNTTARMLSIRDRAFAALGDTNLADLQVQGAAPSFVLNANIPDNTPEANDFTGSGNFPSAPVGAPKFEELDGVRDFAPCSAGDPSKCESGEDARIARRVRGQFTIPCYLDQPGCPTGSRFQYTPDATAPGGFNTDRPLRLGGDTASGNTYAQAFTCNIPRAAIDGDEPPPARPSLYGHGLFGGQGEINQGQLKDLASEHNFAFCATDWDGMATKDVPDAATVLADVSRFPTLIDHVQQGFVNFLYLGRLMIHPQGFGANPAFRVTKGGTARSVLDTRRLFYDGNSQGGIYGGTLAAIGVDHERAVLGVPGMNYSTLLRRSVDFDFYAQVLYRTYPDELERPLILGLLQMLWDRGDPNGYAAHMTSNPLPNTPAHEVLLHVGFGDHQVADVTAQVQARTVGAFVRQPALSRDRFRDPPFGVQGDSFFGLQPFPSTPTEGSGLVFWDIGPCRASADKLCANGTPPPPAANLPPREGKDPHEFPRRSVDARRQKSEFLRIDGRLIDVCGGAPCYADGYTGP